MLDELSAVVVEGGRRPDRQDLLQKMGAELVKAHDATFRLCTGGFSTIKMASPLDASTAATG